MDSCFFLFLCHSELSSESKVIIRDAENELNKINSTPFFKPSSKLQTKSQYLLSC